MKLIVCFTFCLISMGGLAQQTDLTVKIEGLHSEEGTVLLAMYSSKDEFLGDDILTGKEGRLQNGRVTILLEGIPYGEYAISTFIDKNENGLLDTNFIGIPKEPYAFSMNASNNFGPPSFKEAAFELDSPNQTITITY